MAGHVRGFDMLSMRKFVHKNYGDDGVRALGDKLAPRGMSHVASEVILPMEWRPHEEWCALMEAVDDTFSPPGQERAATRLGRFTCEDQMKTVHKVLMRLLRPGWLLENVSAVWSKYHDCGRWEVIRKKSNGASATLMEMPPYPQVYCVTVSAWFERFFQLCGCREVRIVHPECIHRGGHGCRFEASWR